MSTAATAEHNDLPTQYSSAPEPALPLRGDTLLGVCEAIGQDLGFHPNWLRIPFAALILWNPTAIVGIYLGLGCVVVVSRLVYPAPRAKPAQQANLTAPASDSPANVDKAEAKELLAA